MEINDAKIKQINISSQSFEIKIILTEMYLNNSYNVDNIR